LAAKELTFKTSNLPKFLQTETIMDETLKINPYMEINFSILSTNAQHELYDFYLFLVSGTGSVQCNPDGEICFHCLDKQADY